MKLYSRREIFEKIDDFLARHKNGVIEILGPTGSGKTAFSIEVAKYLVSAEIISVDSRQVYQGIDVSASKISRDEMQGIPHHGLDLVTPDQDFSVYDFQQYAFRVLDEIFSKKAIPILCGGTMLWLDAISENYVFTDKKGEKSTKRDIPRYPFLKIGLWWEREILYERINKRAQWQFEHGLVEETKYILSRYNVTRSAFMSFGYKEIRAYLEGELSYEEALSLNQKRNRNYAKRQLTWWRGREDILWMKGE